MILALTTIELSVISGMFTLLGVLIVYIWAEQKKGNDKENKHQDREIKELKDILKGVQGFVMEQVKINERMAGFWEAWKEDRKQNKIDRAASNKDREGYLKSIGEQSRRMDAIADRLQSMEGNIQTKLAKVETATDDLKKTTRLYEKMIESSV